MAGRWYFGNFRFLKNVRVPFFKNPQKKWFLKIPPFARFYFSKTHKKMMFEKIQIFDQLGPSLGPPWAHPLGPSLGPPTWAQLGPTHLGPDAGAAGRILKSRSRPLPTHPGMKYFFKGNPRCWCLDQLVVQIVPACVFHSKGWGTLFKVSCSLQLYTNLFQLD